ncbi:Metallo-dependent hydrolase, partial [Auricularia subglabra TFB-10046 SS5]
MCGSATLAGQAGAEPYPAFIAPPEHEATIILIRNAHVIDGTDAPRKVLDVLVRAGTITHVGELANPAFEGLKAEHVPHELLDIDGTGLVLCPGFIDMHAHSDLHLLTHPSHVPRLTQGVTTEVIGQDGIAFAPVTPATLAQTRKQIAGWCGNPTSAPVFWPAGEEFWQWDSVKSFLDTMDRHGTATNVAFLVPQGNLRMMAVGNEPGMATKEQIEEQKEILRRGIEDGAVGMSSGLTYTPGMYADEDELRELCSVLVEKATVGPNGSKYIPYYCPHTRSYGKDVLGAYQEMLRIGAATGAPIHLTHATLNFPPNKGIAPQFLSIVDSYLAKGLDVTLDTYPYLPGSTTLVATLPSWALAGGYEGTLRRLTGAEGAEVLQRIREDVLVNGTDGCHGMAVDFATIEIGGINSPEGKQDPFLLSLIGRRLAHAAQAVQPGSPEAQQGLDDPFALMVHVLIRDKLATTMIQHVGHEDNVRTVMTSRVHMGGSDGIVSSAKPHPRAWGTMTRYLGFYARDIFADPPVAGPDGAPEIAVSEAYPAPFPDKARALEELIPHLTSRPARRLGLLDGEVRRGLVKEGFAADLVLFDPATVAAVSTFAEPNQPSRGIAYVLVNGKVAVARGVVTGSRGGRTIRRRATGVW